MTAKVLKKCPECGQLQLERLIGSGACVIFKGSGFYCNDYAKPVPPQGAKPNTPT